jgi:hypothetical protein
VPHQLHGAVKDVADQGVDRFAPCTKAHSCAASPSRTAAPPAGVLTDHTPPREEGRYIRRDHVVRPHIERLLALREHFRLGVYSSATLRTVNRAVGLIRSELARMHKEEGLDGGRDDKGGLGTRRSW